MYNSLRTFKNTEKLKVDDFSCENLNLRFHELAQVLLNESLLNINGNNFRIREIEFYGFSGCHNDEYTHKHADEQKYFGGWYFHRFQKTDKSFKGGKFQGLDLTLGDGTNKLGVLIRRIECCNTSEVIDGPSLVVDKVLDLNSANKIIDLVSNMDIDSIQIVNSESLQQNEFVMAPRIGLSYESKAMLKYQFAPFRYLSDPDSAKKEKHLLYLRLYSLYGHEVAKVKTAVRDAEAFKYQRWYKDGCNMGIDTALSKSSKSVQSECELFGAYLATQAPKCVLTQQDVREIVALLDNPKKAS